MKVLIATEKPFAAAAVEGIRKEVEGAGHTLALLEKYTDKAQLLAAVADADALIIRSDKVDAEVLDAAKNLKIVVRAGAGFDNIDLEAATAHKVVAENTPGQNANAVAELVMGLLVYAVRNFYNGKSGSELMGKRLGLLAFGNVGRNVARVAKGFGMDVYAYDAYCPAEAIEALRHTCRRPDPSLAYPNNEYGHGEIDAYRGLLYLIGADGIEKISRQHSGECQRPKIYNLGGQRLSVPMKGINIIGGRKVIVK